MKRFLVFALVLVFTGVSAFALDLGNGLTAAGEVKTGLNVGTVSDAKDEGDYKTKVEPWNDDAGASFRTRLTLGYTGDWGGAKIRFQSGGGDFFAKYAYGWANLLDSKIVLSAGIIGDDLWGLGKLGANVFDPAIDNVTGVRAEFKLLDGLSFGAAWKGPSEATDIDKALQAWVIGGLYKSSLFSVAASLGINPATDKVPPKYGWKDDDDDSDTADTWVQFPETPAYDPSIRALIGLEVNPIEVLKVVVDVDIDSRKAKDHGATGYFRIGPKVQFSSGPLTAHVQGDIIVPNDDEAWNQADKDGDIPVEEKGDTTVAFRLGGAYDITSAINAYLQVGSDNVLWFAGEEDKFAPGAGLYIKPGIVFTLGTASVEIFDKINGIGAAEISKPGFLEFNPLRNQFQIDFNWSF
jgi:hypothetical protein